MVATLPAHQSSHDPFISTLLTTHDLHHHAKWTINPLGEDLLTIQVRIEKEVGIGYDSRPCGERASSMRSDDGRESESKINTLSFCLNLPKKDLLKKLFGTKQNNASTSTSAS